MELKNLLRDYIGKNREIRVVYDIDRGEIELNGGRYSISKRSFSEVGNSVKDVLKDLFGEYRTVPLTFNSKSTKTRSSGQRCLLLDSRDF